MNAVGYSLTLTSALGESIDLYDSTEVFLASSSGMDFDADVSTMERYGTDGAFYINCMQQPRNISFTIHYQYTPDDEAVKMLIHRICAIGEPITIHYISPNKDMTIRGYCEKCNTPENAYPMVTTISIVCPDPYWIQGDGTLTEKAVPANFNYTGTARTGFITDITVLEDIQGLRMTTNGRNFDCRGTYPAGTIISINSNTTYKSFNVDGHLKYEDTYPGQLYPYLIPGNNSITFDKPNKIEASIKYNILYRG